MNNLSVTGRLGMDAEFKDAGGTEIGTFSIFVKKYKKGEKDAGFWLNVTQFKPNQFLKDTLKKGVAVAVSGRLDIEKYKENWYTKMIAMAVDVFPKSDDGFQAPQGDTKPVVDQPKEEDLPF